MSMKWKWGGWLLSVALFVGMMTVGDAALAYTVTGTVTNSSGGAGRVYVMMASADGSTPYFYGTSIASVANGAPANYTIHGVPAGSYSIAAYVDRLNTGTLHIYDSASTSSSFSVSGSTTAPAFTISAPPNPTVPSSVGQVNVAATSNGVMVQWEGPTLSYGGGGPQAELADSYVIYWGTSPNPGNGSAAAGSKTVTANGGDYHVFMSTGLTPGTSYYFTVKAINAGGSPAFSSTPTSYSIAAPTGATTVSGRVYSPGISKSSSTPLYIALVPNNGPVYIAYIASPTDTVNWSATGVQPGTYSVYVILDLYNDGFTTEVGKALSRGMHNGAAPSVAVLSGASTVTAPDVTLTAPNSHTSVSTQNNNNYSYNLQFNVFSGLKRPVSVTVNSGPNLSEPIDLLSMPHFGNNGPQVMNFSTRPLVGDTYSVTVNYLDYAGTAASSETLSPKVTGVVTSFPTYIFPNGNTSPINGDTLFTWATPSPLPAGYYEYNLNVNNNFNQIWNPQDNSNGNMPSTQLSILYNSDGSASQSPLTSGTYNWGVNVHDSNDNMGWGNGNTFYPQSGGPSISSFNPTTGSASANTSVIITGSGFSNVSNVSFGGVSANYVVNSSTQITATVPANAPVGPITVTANNVTGVSSTMFNTTVTFSGIVQIYSTGNPLNGATVTLENSNNPVVSTTTSGAGSFSITVPSGVPFALRVKNSGYHDTLTATHIFTEDQTAGSSLKLYTDSDASGIGITLPMTKGIIAASVKDWDTGGNVTAGATLTATSFLHPDTPYTVNYPSGTSTDSTGTFYVKNVDEGDVVAVTATLAGYVTQPRTYVTHTGVVSTTRVNATPIPIVSASPSGGSITTSQQITLAVSNPVNVDSYSIYYTTNGNDPKTSGMFYSGPFTLPAGSATVKFYAVNNTHSDAGSVVTATYTVTPGTYNLSVTISGNGTVYNINPSGPSYTCNSASCSNSFNAGSLFTLNAPNTANLLFTGWTGTGSASGCSGTADCSFTLTANTSVAATFIPLPPVKVVGATPALTYFNLLSSAYVTLPASSSVTMQAQGVPLSGNFNLSNTVQLILKGGYDNSFANQTGLTTLQGALTIGLGSLTINDFVISP